MSIIPQRTVVESTKNGGTILRWTVAEFYVKRWQTITEAMVEEAVIL
jgi:hypothetical protein